MPGLTPQITRNNGDVADEKGEVFEELRSENALKITRSNPELIYIVKSGISTQNHQVGVTLAGSSRLKSVMKLMAS